MLTVHLYVVALQRKPRLASDRLGWELRYAVIGVSEEHAIQCLREVRPTECSEADRIVARVVPSDDTYRGVIGLGVSRISWTAKPTIPLPEVTP